MRPLLLSLLFSVSLFGQASPPNYCAPSGGTDTYSCNYNPAATAYSTGRSYYFKADVANTGTASINFNSLGAKTIVIAAGGVTTTLSDNAIRAGQMVEVVYDGTNMQMQSTSGIAPQASGLSLLIANNLTDVASQPTALTNLLGSSVVPIANGGARSQGSNLCGTSDLCVSGNFTSAQFVGITSTGSSWLQVIPAPASGSYISVDSAFIEHAYNGTAYGSGSAVLLYYGTAANAAISSNCGAFIFTTAAKFICQLTQNSIGANLTTVNGVAVNVGINGSSYTCASTCGPIYYWVKYHIVTGIQ